MRPVLASPENGGITIETASRPLAALETLLGSAHAETPRRARELLTRFELGRLSRMDPHSLRREGGVTPAQAARLGAAFVLGRAVEEARHPRGRPLATAARVFELVAPEVRGLDKETFHALVLDAKHRLLAWERVSEGTLTTSLVHPREVFRTALRHAAAALIVVHNHPSGDPEPSAEDLSVTGRLIRAGKLLGVPLLDHVVVGDGVWVSIRDRLAFETVR